VQVIAVGGMPTTRSMPRPWRTCDGNVWEFGGLRRKILRGQGKCTMLAVIVERALRLPSVPDSAHRPDIISSCDFALGPTRRRSGASYGISLES
jgi:hypothetical protein